MKIQHKPFNKVKAKRGLGQKNILNFKSKEELCKEIKDLENTRYNYYIEFLKSLQLIELEYKSSRNSQLYKSEVNSIGVDRNYKEKRTHEVKTYNELVKPIDNQLHLLRLEAIKYKEVIDKRLKIIE